MVVGLRPRTNCLLKSQLPEEISFETVCQITALREAARSSAADSLLETAAGGQTPLSSTTLHH